MYKPKGGRRRLAVSLLLVRPGSPVRRTRRQCPSSVAHLHPDVAEEFGEVHALALRLIE